MADLSANTRPSADEFLQIIRRQQHGKLKIYLGASPGVGKTYQMLVEGNRLRSGGVDVVIEGKEEVIGGTSVGAPSWQGIWARVEGAHKHQLGFAGPLIYGTEPEAAFKDITVGDNTLYPCTPGWDYVTGRGTPDIEVLVADA